MKQENTNNNENTNITLNLSRHTVEWLRKHGYKVRVFHFRYIPTPSPSGGFLLNPINKITNMAACLGKGGRTEIQLTTPEKKEFVGYSNCNPKDSFNYKLGVRIALGRLMLVKE